jgi:hypothetical protein
MPPVTNPKQSLSGTVRVVQPTACIVHYDGQHCLYNEILFNMSTWMSFKSDQRWQMELLLLIHKVMNPSQKGGKIS